MNRDSIGKAAGRILAVISLLALSIAAHAEDSKAVPELLWQDQGLTTPLGERQTGWDAAGQTHAIWVDQCLVKDVKFDEVERHTRLHDDIAKVIGAIAGGAAPAAVCNPTAKSRRLNTMPIPRAFSRKTRTRRST